MKKWGLIAVAVLLAWPTQYLFLGLLVALWKMFTFAISIGLKGLLLFIFVPIGWIVLFFMWRSNANAKRLERTTRALEKSQGIEHRSYWHPWLLDQIKAA